MYSSRPLAQSNACVFACVLWNHRLETADRTKETLWDKVSATNAQDSMETVSLQNRLLSASVGMGRFIPCETLLEISVKCPSILPHEMPSVLFNKGKRSSLLGTGSGRLSIRLIWQTDYRQLRNHNYAETEGTWRGRRIQTGMTLGQSPPRGGVRCFSWMWCRCISVNPRLLLRPSVCAE